MNNHKHWSTSKWPGVVLSMAVLVVALGAVGFGAARLGKSIVPAGTFRTNDLVVDNSASIGLHATGDKQGDIEINTGEAPIKVFHTGNGVFGIDVELSGNDIHPTPTGEREAIQAEIQGSMNATATNVVAYGVQATVQVTRSGGANTLKNVGVISDAQGGDDNLSFLGIHGTLENDQGSLLKGANTIESLTVPTGGIDVSVSGEPVTLGDTVSRFAMVGGVANSPSIAMGVSLGSQPYMIAAKPTFATSVDAFWLALDTTVNAAARGGFIVSRGPGGFGASVEGGIAIASASGFPLTGMSANDIGLFMEGGGSIAFGADNSTFTVATALTQSNHWNDDTSTGLPVLDAGCMAGGGSAIVGNDNRFMVTTGAGSTACTITYVKTRTLTPMCEITPYGTATFPTCIPSATQMVCTTNLPATTYVFDCHGQQGST